MISTASILASTSRLEADNRRLSEENAQITRHLLCALDALASLQQGSARIESAIHHLAAQQRIAA